MRKQTKAAELMSQGRRIRTKYLPPAPKRPLVITQIVSAKKKEMFVLHNHFPFSPRLQNVHVSVNVHVCLIYTFCGAFVLREKRTEDSRNGFYLAVYSVLSVNHTAQNPSIPLSSLLEPIFTPNSRSQIKMHKGKVINRNVERK